MVVDASVRETPALYLIGYLAAKYPTQFQFVLLKMLHMFRGM